MDGTDFKVPSPKRQRTNSPEPNRMATNPPAQLQSTPQAGLPGIQSANAPVEHSIDVAAGDNSMLDTLMQHVESESTLVPTSTQATNSSAEQVAAPPAAVEHIPAPTVTTTLHDTPPPHTSVELEDVSNATQQVSHDLVMEDRDAQPPKEPEENTRLVGNEETTQDTSQGKAQTEAQVSATLDSSTQAHEAPQSADQTAEPAPVEAAQMPQDADSEMAQAAAMVDGIPPMLESAPTADAAEGAEWEVDSSPYESSSDSDSSSDDSSDEDADGDYAMLDPEEQARILMQGDGGSDDEGDKTKHKGESAGLKTANEQSEGVLPVPDITITEEMKIEELGNVEGIVDRIVLIKAKVSGEYQVLDSGSLLCLRDRKVAGVVAELLGRVEQPMYMVRFASDQEIEDRGLLQKGTTVYYVPSHSTFVFTQPLKAIKGSDASNFHDEEVGDEEMEFSDDEAEAEHKRNLKLKRQGKLGEAGRGRGSGRGGRGGQRGGRPPFEQPRDLNGAAYGNGSLEMNYDDVNDGEDTYTPLSRPTNLHEMMGSAQPIENPAVTSLPPFTQSNQNRGRGGRGGRDRGRNDRGRGRGSNRGGAPYADRSQQQLPPQAQTNPYQQQHPFAFPPPPPPMLTPQTSGYPGSLATSPMTPLPNQQFNFAAAFQNPQSYNTNNYQQQIPGGFNQHPQTPYFNPAAAMQQQYGQQQPQQPYGQPQQPQQSHAGFQNGWQNNQAAIAEVQRQLEQMRRSAGGGAGGQ